MPLTHIIGSKYIETKNNLISIIIENPEIAVEKEPEKPHACYICRKKIEGNILEIRIFDDEGNQNYSTYAIDKYCYNRALIKIIKR